jgi:hypothetical protein
MSKSYKQNRQDDLSSNNHSKKGNDARNRNNRRRGASLLDLEDASLQEMFASRFSNDCND